MKIKSAIAKLLMLFVLLQASLASAEPNDFFAPPLNNARDRLFDEGWLFHRGDVEGAEASDFADENWRKVSLPHDWSVEPLPADVSGPSFQPLCGEWQFTTGNNNAYAAVAFDDSAWPKITLPVLIPHCLQKTYYWFRREVILPTGLAGQDVIFDLGRIDDCDEFYVNGQKVGETGVMPKNQPQGECISAWDQNRDYKVAAKFLKPGTNVLAICLYNNTGIGGFRPPESTKRKIVGPFDSRAIGGTAAGYTVGGTGWYRKHFTIPAADAGKHFEILFGGVYMNSDVWLNGHLLGERPYGYTSFYYDLTPYLIPGSENVLAVRVRNEGLNSRWYSGSGIYRHVWLTTTDPTHIRRWGVQITTPETSEQLAKVVINSEVEAQSEGDQLHVRITDSQGKTVAESDTQISGNITPITLTVKKPKLWSLEEPNLYHAQVQIVRSGKILDEVGQNFGIRTISFTAQNGFQLNGKTIKIWGGCLHHDNGLLGAADYDRADLRKMEIMKANGYNAVRASHNPESDAFYEACDRVGLLVLDESFDQWTVHKTPQDYGGELFDKWGTNDVELWVRRTRNHPSIFMRSFGNEIIFDAKDGGEVMGCEVFTRLKTEAAKWDSARPYTTALGGGDFEMTNMFGFLALQDVKGHNYTEAAFGRFNKLHPDWVQISTESNPDIEVMPKVWNQQEKNHFLIGSFVWSGFEYIGESWSGWVGLKGEKVGFPSYAAACGLIDITGYPKCGQLFRNVINGTSQIEVLVLEPLPAGSEYARQGWSNPNEYPCWNWPEFAGKPIDVRVVCRAPELRLKLNGQIVGEFTNTPDEGGYVKMDHVFKVPYKAGELLAEGIENGNVVVSKKIITPGKPVGFRLTSDRSLITTSRSDLAYINVEVVDASGQVVQPGRYNVSYKVSGVGVLEACGNGYHKDIYSFRNPDKGTTWHGRSQVILRPKGQPGIIILKVESSDFPAKTLTIPVVAS